LMGTGSKPRAGSFNRWLERGMVPTTVGRRARPPRKVKGHWASRGTRGSRNTKGTYGKVAT